MTTASAGTETEPRGPIELDAVAVDDDHPVLDHLFAVHGDQPRTGQGHPAGGPGVVGREADVDPGRGRFRQGLGRTVDEGEGLLKVPREQFRPHRPLQTTGIARPVQPLSGIAGDPGLRQGLAVSAEADRTTGGDEGGDIGVEPFGPGDPVFVRRQDELCRILRRQMGAFVMSSQVDRLERAIFALAAGEEDAVTGRAEARCDAVVGDEGGLAAGGGDPVDAGVLAPQGGGQIAVARGAIGDGATVRREAGLQIMTRLTGDDPAVAARGRHDADGAQVTVAPGRIDDRATVTGPGRIQFEMVGLARQPPRRAGRQVADPQIAQRLVHDLATVGRGGGPADHLDVEPVGRDLDREAHGVLDAARVGDVEGNVGDGPGGYVDAADLAAGPEDDGAVVGGPADRRIDAVDGPGLLQVTVERIVDRRLAAGVQILHIQDRLVANAADEGERAPVR